MCVPWRIHDCAMTHLWMCDASAQLARLQSQLRVCRDSWMRVPLIIDVCAMTCWQVCHELCENVRMPQHNWPTCNHRGVCHDSFYVYAMTYWRVRHDTFTSVLWIMRERVMPQHNWYKCVCHDSSKCMQWIIDVCAMTHSHVCLDSFVHVWCLSTTGALAITRVCAMT